MGATPDWSVIANFTRQAPCWCLANPHTHRMVARLGDASAVVEHVINKELHAVLSGSPEGSRAHSMRDAHFAWMGGVCVFLPKGASARPLLKLRTSAIEGRAIPVDLPIELKEASVTEAEWACIAEQLQAERRAHLCHQCPWYEASTPDKYTAGPGEE